MAQMAQAIRRAMERPAPLVAELHAQLTGPAKLEAAIRAKNLHDFMHREAMQ